MAILDDARLIDLTAAALREMVRVEMRAALAEAHPKADDADELLTPKEAAAEAKVAPHTIYAWKKRGTIKIEGEDRRWRVRRSELFKAATR